MEPKHYEYVTVFPPTGTWCLSVFVVFFSSSSGVGERAERLREIDCRTRPLYRRSGQGTRCAASNDRDAGFMSRFDG